MSEQSKVSWSVRLSAVLLAALGCILCLNAVSSLFLLLVQSYGPLRTHISVGGQSALQLGVYAVLAAVLAVFCLRAAPALYEAQRWAARVAMVAGVVVIAWSLWSLVFLGVRGGYQITMAALAIAAGVWWCVSLNLPHTRSQLRDATPA